MADVHENAITPADCDEWPTIRRVMMMIMEMTILMMKTLNLRRVLGNK